MTGKELAGWGRLPPTRRAGWYFVRVLEMRAVKRRYALEDRKTGRPPEIRIFMHDPKGGFEWTSVGIVGSGEWHGRTRPPVSCRVYPILEDENEPLFGIGEGDDEVVPVAKEELILIQRIPPTTTGGGRGSLVRVSAYEQESSVPPDDFWN